MSYELVILLASLIDGRYTGIINSFHREWFVYWMRYAIIMEISVTLGQQERFVHGFG